MNGMNDYAYINARIRAMQGKLFDQARYEALVTQATPTGLVEALRDSPYAGVLERTAETPDAPPSSNMSIRVDEALRQDLVWSLSKLHHFVSDRPRDLVEALLLRWDAYNLKTLLRGKRAAAPMEEILASTFPVGNLDEIALAELARAPTVRSVADTLETWRLPLARPLREGLRVHGESDTLQPLEFELDRFTFAQAFRVVAEGDDNDRIVRDYLRALVDRSNLLTALRYLEERSALSPIEAGRHFLELEGRFTLAHYEAVVGAHDLRHGLSLLADTPFRWLAGTFADGEIVSLPLVERKVDRALLHKAIGLSRSDPLGIGVAVVYVERKVNEVRNLRMIMHGKVLGMGAEQIREWLII